MSLAISLTKSLAGLLSGSAAVDPNILHIGNSYTQLWQINNLPLGTGQEISRLVNATAVAASRDGDGESYWQGGAGFQTNYSTPACQTKIDSEQWTHAVLQDVSTGATGAGLASHITYGNLFAEAFWDTNPRCKILLRETPAYQVGHSAYPGTYDDPDDMIAQIQSGYEQCRDNINTLHPDKPATYIVKCGTLIWALGGNLDPSNPSFRSFHDEIDNDHTHPNTERAWLEAFMIFVRVYGIDPTPYATAAVAAVSAIDADFALNGGITATQLATWAYRYVQLGNYPVLFVTHPADTSVVDGDDAVFTVTVRATGTVTYQWYEDNVLIPGATSATYTKVGVATGDTGKEYKCIATNSEGSTESAVAELTVTASFVPVYLNFARFNTTTPAPASDGYYWNDIKEDGDSTLPNVNTTWSLIDRTNAASGLTLRMIADTSGFAFENVGAPGIAGLPASVSSTMWGSQNGGSGTFTIRVEGLTPGSTYRFNAGAFRNSGSNRTTLLTFTGAGSPVNLSYDAGINLSSLPFVDVVADGSGYVSILCDDSTPTTLAVGYLGVIQITKP